MTMHRTGTPPKTKRSGVFPHSIRNVVIISSIIFFLITGVIGTIGIWQNWGFVYNLIFLIFAVASVIIGVLAFWSSTKPTEENTPAMPTHPQQTPQSPVQVHIYNFAAHGADPPYFPTAAYQAKPGNVSLENYYLTNVKNREAQTVSETGAEDRQPKPENLDDNNSGDSMIKSSEKGLPDTRRGCIVEAQEYVKKAYDLLNPKLNILPENVTDAMQYLKTAKRDIEQLKALLKADPPPTYARIFAEIDIVIDQIDNHLAPSFQSTASPYKNAQNKFQALLEALGNLDTLIPR